MGQPATCTVWANLTPLPLKRPSFGMPATGRRARWCAGCVQGHPGAVNTRTMAPFVASTSSGWPAGAPPASKRQKAEPSPLIDPIILFDDRLDQPTRDAAAAEEEPMCIKLEPCVLVSKKRPISLLHADPRLQVRQPPSWPRSWANFSLLQLYHHRNAWANLYFLGHVNTFLCCSRGCRGLRRSACGAPRPHGR